MVRAIRRQGPRIEREASADVDALRGAGTCTLAAEQIARRHGDERLRSGGELRDGDGIDQPGLGERQQVAGPGGGDRRELGDRCHCGKLSVFRNGVRG